MSFSYAEGKAYFVTVPQERAAAEEIINAFEPFWSSTSVEKIGQNIKYDLSVLMNYGVEVRGPLFDTMIAHYLIQPDMRHNMDILAETYLNYETISIEQVLGKKGKTQKNMRDIASADLLDYAAEDADITLRLHNHIWKKLNQSPELASVLSEIEVPLATVLAKMEQFGVLIDSQKLGQQSQDLASRILQLENEVHILAGEEFNLGSTKQLQEILFKKLDLPVLKKTPKGAPSTSEEVLQELALTYLSLIHI